MTESHLDEGAAMPIHLDRIGRDMGDDAVVDAADVREVRPSSAPVASLRDAAGLSVIVVTYNSASVLPGLLDSLRDGLEELDDVEIVVVDNQSRDGSPEIARRHAVGARVVETGRNAGYSAGINAATATIAPDRNLLILNPDIRLRRGAARRLVERLDEDPAAGVVVPRILNEDGTLSRSLRREPSVATAWSEALLGGALCGRMGMGEIVGRSPVYQEGGSVEWATGAVLAVSARARRIVGDWDETFFLYSEEIDYMRRVREAGLSVSHRPDARAVHIGGEYEENPRLFALLTANRIRYFRRHHGRAATLLFRAGVVTGEALRSARSPGHRAALKAAITGRAMP